MSISTLTLFLRRYFQKILTIMRTRVYALIGMRIYIHNQARIHSYMSTLTHTHAHIHTRTTTRTDVYISAQTRAIRTDTTTMTSSLTLRNNNSTSIHTSGSLRRFLQRSVGDDVDRNVR